MSKESRRILSEAYGDGGGKSSFLGRLENDLQRRDSSRKELQSKYYSTEALYQDPSRANRVYKQDLEFVKNFISTNGLLNEVSHQIGFNTVYNPPKFQTLPTLLSHNFM
jgi:hypothetical protein